MLTEQGRQQQLERYKAACTDVANGNRWSEIKPEAASPSSKFFSAGACYVFAVALRESYGRGELRMRADKKHAWLRLQNGNCLDATGLSQDEEWDMLGMDAVQVATVSEEELVQTYNAKQEFVSFADALALARKWLAA